MLYTTDRGWAALGAIQQKIQLERHAAHGVCPHLGPPFELMDLTERQQKLYSYLWKRR